MKHQAEFPTKDRTAKASASGELQMFALAGVTEDGAPILLGADPTTVMALEPAPEDTEGVIAICKTFDGGKLAVLGYVGRKEFSKIAAAQVVNGDVVLGTGEAKIRLTADGRIRMQANDVKLESHGRMALVGAYINLN